MTYTTDQAIALAREVGAEEDWGSVFQMNRKDLTAFANAVRKQTLLEAAELCSKRADKDMFGFPNDAQGFMEMFSRMAEVE